MESASLADYLRPLRRSRLLIAAVAVTAVAAALVVSLLQPSEYSAKSVLLVQDQNQALAVVGTSVGVINTPADQARLIAETFLTTQLLEQVQARLETEQGVDELRQDLTVTPDATTNLVNVEAAAGSAEAAARLADVVAETGAQIQNQGARSRYDTAADNLKRRLRALQASGTPDPTLEGGFQEQIARLQSLSSVAAPVEVAAKAVVPGSPVSPKPVRNAVLALILGLFLGVIAAYLRQAFDKTIDGAGEMADLIDYPTLGRVSEEGLGHAGRSPHGLGPLAELDAEAIKILRANVEALDPSSPSRVILVTSAMPKEGKSTVAASLADALAIAGRRTLLVECDLRQPVLAQRLGVERVPGLAEYLQGEVAPKAILRLPALNGGAGDNGQPGTKVLVVLPAGAPPAQPAELLQGALFRSFMDKVQRAYDTIVIDSSPLLPVADTLALVPFVDRVLLCVRARQTTTEQALAALTALRRHGDRPTGLVTTGLKKADQGYYGYPSHYGAPQRQIVRSADPSSEPVDPGESSALEL